VHKSLYNIDTTDTTATTQEAASGPETESDPDLTRAQDLVALHHSVKVKYLEEGHDAELLQCRRDIAAVLSSLDGTKRRQQ